MEVDLEEIQVHQQSKELLILVVVEEVQQKVVQEMLKMEDQE
jgi:hypothetical protein